MEYQPKETSDHLAQAQDVSTWALTRFHPKIALSCSFQHTVLIHILANIRSDIRVFAIDTGRLPEETYDCAQKVEKRFGISIEWYFPQSDSVQNLLRTKGVFSFRESVEARQECCAIRKVEPLNRALASLEAWITGNRKDQSVTRQNIQLVEKDNAHNGIYKINPLAHWTREEMLAYAKKHDLPYNRLFDKCYTSIGCGCCTRAIEPGESQRAGRWWWENSEHKECGLHVSDWTI